MTSLESSVHCPATPCALVLPQCSFSETRSDLRVPPSWPWRPDLTLLDSSSTTLMRTSSMPMVRPSNRRSSISEGLSRLSREERRSPVERLEGELLGLRKLGDESADRWFVTDRGNGWRLYSNKSDSESSSSSSPKTLLSANQGSAPLLLFVLHTLFRRDFAFVSFPEPSRAFPVSCRESLP